MQGKTRNTKKRSSIINKADRRYDNEIFERRKIASSDAVFMMMRSARNRPQRNIPSALARPVIICGSTGTKTIFRIKNHIKIKNLWRLL